MGRDALSREERRALAAGFLMGEAYFSTHGDRSCEIKVDHVDPEPLWFLRALFGGSIRPKPARDERSRSYYRWRVSGDRARAAAEEIHPYMLTKAFEVEAVALSKAHPASTDTGAWLRQRAAHRRSADFGVQHHG